jgi:hypothetical protein
VTYSKQKYAVSKEQIVPLGILYLSRLFESVLYFRKDLATYSITLDT